MAWKFVKTYVTLNIMISRDYVFFKGMEFGIQCHKWQVQTRMLNISGNESDKNVWLFDILKDPFERLDLSNKCPDVVKLYWRDSYIITLQRYPLDSWPMISALIRKNMEGSGDHAWIDQLWVWRREHWWIDQHSVWGRMHGLITSEFEEGNMNGLITTVFGGGGMDRLTSTGFGEGSMDRLITTGFGEGSLYELNPTGFGEGSMDELTNYVSQWTRNVNSMLD